MNEIKRNRLLNLRAAVSDWNPSVGIQFSVIQAVFVQLIDIVLGGRRRNDEDEEDGGIELPAKKRLYPSTFILTLDREIRLFKRLLRGRPVELTDASSVTATIREILETEAVVLIEKPDSTKIKEYDLDGSVFWSKDKTRAMIVFD